jgi:ABC-type nitrate/sulfonate/bicarbonate transport system substrate-binding protein
MLAALAVALAVPVSVSVVSVHVIVPDAHNLQDLAFFVAQGAGYFRDEGLDVVLDVPDAPSEARKLLAAPEAQAAVLSPPLYLEQIADGTRWRVVANLMQNDGINLIVRRSVLAERKLSPALPLRDRLLGLRGLKLGVAPGPRSRLDALFASVGLKPADVVEVVILTGFEQNQALADHKVDALFAHTPFLERALVEQDAELYVNQSAGEVPALASRMIHALCVTEELAAKQPALVRKLVRAIARAEALVHKSTSQAVAAAQKAQPQAKPALLRKIVELYAPAIPATPAVSAAGVRAAVALFPAGKTPPVLPPDVERFVLPRFAAEAARP